MVDVMDKMAQRFRTEGDAPPRSISELVQVAEQAKLSFGQTVVAEAMAREGKSCDEVLHAVLKAFEHNLEALELGLTRGKSFLLGSVATDLAVSDGRPLLEDPLINRALIYTLAAEVGNHEIGLQPCAGTGDSCPYTGLLRALMEEDLPEEQVAVAAAVMLKVGSIFKAGKRTTGCNMEGYGAGAAAVAGALTDLRGGTPAQVSKAIVLALSPTIAVPCTPRVMVEGLCATHISGAILIGNQAAQLVLRTSLPVEVDADVMIAMAARVHVEAAPIITAINLEYLEPYFKKKPEIEAFVDDEIRRVEAERAIRIRKQAREEVRALLAAARPLTQVFGKVVVGGSSIAVGSPTNMARICHAMVAGDIQKIDIDLTLDLFARRAINIPAILMGAIFGAETGDAETYRHIFHKPEVGSIDIAINKVDAPEVQRIRIQASQQSAMVDARNRGGGRVALVDASPSLAEALKAARKLGIEIAAC